MSFNWINKIRNHEVTPPGEAWQNITNELDKKGAGNAEDLKTRLLAHEETPPASALNNIFQELDKDTAHPAPGYIERIRNYSNEAPVDAWDNIVTALDKEEAKIVPLAPRRKKLKVIYLRMAAVAAVIALILVVVLPIFKRSQVDNEQFAVLPAKVPVDQASSSNTKNSTPATPNNPGKTIPATTDFGNRVNTAAQPANNYVQDYVRSNKPAELAQNPALNNKEKLQNSKGETPMDIALLNTPNTYISVRGADGQTIKVSSKFSNLIEYLTGVKSDTTMENIEVIIKDSPRWRKVFSEWRDKMTNNTLAPSFSNFMDIIELSKILEEKNK